MLLRIADLRGVGRFTRLEHPTADEARFRRFTLLFGPNGSGKSTLADVLRSAGLGRADICRRRQRLGDAGSTTAPTAVLVFAGANQRLKDGAWDPCPHPIEVYDGVFVDENLFVGRSPSKAHRIKLLEVALGADEVQWKRTLDDLQARSVELNQRIREVEARLKSTAAQHGLNLQELLELPPCDDPEAAVQRASTAHESALRAADFTRRGRFKPVPTLQRRDTARLRSFLSRDVGTLAEDAEQTVRAHIDGLLRGDDAFVRKGLSFATIDACPFCTQDIGPSSIVHLYRRVFDDAHQAFVAKLDAADRMLREQLQLLPSIRDRLVTNDELATTWSDVGVHPDAGALRDALDSDPGQELERILEVLDDHRKKLRGASSRVEEAASAAERWNLFVDATESYNGNVATANANLDRWTATHTNASLDDARRKLAHAEAVRARHGKETDDLFNRRRELLGSREELATAKKALADKGKTASAARLKHFADRLNQLLERFGTSFRVERPDTERGGGKPALRFALNFGDATVDIKDARGEESFRDLLSDGDRSALAFALFVTDLHDRDDLADRIVVFDDPMTSMDADRMHATVGLLREIAAKARQVIVLSHNAPFLAELHDGDATTATLQVSSLDTRIRAWSPTDETQHEHVRRARRLDDFVQQPTQERAEQAHHDIRCFLEGYLRFRWWRCFRGASTHLHTYVKQLADDPRLATSLGMSDDDVTELSELCSFAARSHHDPSMTGRVPATPIEVRTFAERAMRWTDQVGRPTSAQD